MGTGNILLILRGVKVPFFRGWGFDILMVDNESNWSVYVK